MMFIFLDISIAAESNDKQTVHTHKDAVNTVERKRQHHVQVLHKKKPDTAVMVKRTNNIPKQTLPKAVVTDSYLWDLYKSGQFIKLGKLIQQTKKNHPGWLPDAKLERLLFERKVMQQVSLAIKRQDFVTVLNNYQAQPQLFGCERNQWRLFLIEGHLQQKQKKHALDVYHQILESCDFTVRFETLEHAAQHLNEHEFDAIFKRQKKWALSRTEQRALKQLNQRHLLGLAQQANQRHNTLQALHFADKLSPMLLKTKEVPMLEALGWLYFDQKEYKLALKHFKAAYQEQQSKPSLEGLAYVYLQLKQYQALESLVFAHQDEFGTSEVLENVLPVLAGQALADKRYQKVLITLSRLQEIRPLKNSELEMYAWAQYHMKQFMISGDIFEKLYQSQPTVSHAQGLYFSLTQLNKQDKLLALSQKLGGELQRLVTQAKTSRVQMLQQPEALTGTNRTFSNVQLAQMSRDRYGNFALSRMNLQKRVLAFTVPSIINDEKRTDKILFRYERFDINLGEGTLPQPFSPNQPFNPGFAIGTMEDIGQNNYALPVIQSKHHGYEWLLGYEYDAGGGTYHLNMGQLVYDAFNVSQLKADAGYVHEDDDGMYRLQVYKKPLPSSLLSYLGLPDPYKGADYWGAVSRYGAEVSGYMSLPNALSLSGRFIVESRVGEQVATNQYLSAYTGLSYQFDWDDFLYFTAGPYMRWEHSAMNQNHYTIGHGGYFSPQYLWDKGLSLSFMTATDKTWLVKTSASTGYQNIREDASPYFPLGSNTILNVATYPSSVNAELHYQLHVSAVFALNGKWRVNTDFLRNSSGVAYNESSYMLGLTYYFDEHGSHVGVDDFTAYGLSPLY